nr:ABC transporter ATP-binding protein [Halobacillus litoralis]
MKRLWQYMSDKKLTFILVLSAIVVSSSLSLLGPYILGQTVDLVLGDPSARRLLKSFILLFAIYLLHSLFLWLQNYWMIGMAQSTVQAIRSHLFRHVQLLPLPFFQKIQQGELMSRLTNDIENISRTLNSAIVQFVTSVLTILGTIGFMLWISPLLTLLTLTIIPMMYGGMKWITKRTGTYFKQQQRNLGVLNGYVEEMFSGQSIIRMFSKEHRVIREFEEKNRALKHSGYYAQVYTGFIPKLMNLLNNISFAIIVGAGGILALHGYLTIGMIVTFTTYSRQFTRPLNDLANQFNMILSAVAGAERVFQILDEDVEKKNDYDSMDIQRIKGEVTFQNVDFSYEEDRKILSKINFHAEPGQTVALVGPTGAGKSTIISLLARFYDPDEGSILLDGVDLKNVTRESLRSHMGVVLQDATLFHTTIRENIRYGRLNATDAEVEQAAKAARAHDFITFLPDGYDTVLDSDGKGISHGQRQLISIARAMIADPALLILDEATSSIDTVTEMRINEGLTALMKGRTSFVIAHRLHTIRSADIILVLEGGRIMERGDHTVLMRRGGKYAAFIHAQSNDARIKQQG